MGVECRCVFVCVCVSVCVGVIWLYSNDRTYSGTMPTLSDIRMPGNTESVKGADLK